MMVDGGWTDAAASFYFAVPLVEGDVWAYKIENRKEQSKSVLVDGSE